MGRLLAAAFLGPSAWVPNEGAQQPRLAPMTPGHTGITHTLLGPAAGAASKWHGWAQPSGHHNQHGYHRNHLGDNHLIHHERHGHNHLDNYNHLHPHSHSRPRHGSHPNQAQHPPHSHHHHHHRLHGELFLCLLPLLLLLWLAMLAWLALCSAHHFLLLAAVRRDRSWPIRWQPPPQRGAHTCAANEWGAHSRTDGSSGGCSGCSAPVAQPCPQGATPEGDRKSVV